MLLALLFLSCVGQARRVQPVREPMLGSSHGKYLHYQREVMWMPRVDAKDFRPAYPQKFHSNRVVAVSHLVSAVEKLLLGGVPVSGWKCAGWTTQLVCMPHGYAPFQHGRGGSVAMRSEASRIRTSGNAVVKLKARSTASAAVQAGATRAELLEYLAGAQDILPRLPQPAGAVYRRKPGGSPSEFLFTLPKMQLFDVSLQPTSETTVMVDKSGAMVLTSDQARLSGSHHVDSLGLNERYACGIEVRFAPAASGGRLEGTAALNVDVDLPLPFSLMPREPQQAAGSAVLTATMQLVMTEFARTLANDFALWHARRVPPVE